MQDTQQLPDLSRLKDDFTVVHAWEKLELPGTPAPRGKSPFRPDKHPSFTIYDSGRRWKDHATGEGGDVIDFIAKACNLSIKDAIAEFRKLAGGEATTATPSTTATTTKVRPDPDAEGRRKRALWKPEDLTRPTPVQKAAVAFTRNLPNAVPDIAEQIGVLRVGSHRDKDGVTYPSYVLQSAAFRQYRRLDGKEWTCGKVWTQPGSDCSGFIGVTPRLGRLDDDEELLVVEGVIGYLEALALQWLTAPLGRRFYILASTNADTKFSNNPEVLLAIGSRKVLIVPDNDAAGERAAATWGRELTGQGCAVRIARLPDGYKDIGDLLKRGSDAVPALKHLVRKEVR